MSTTPTLRDAAQANDQFQALRDQVSNAAFSEDGGIYSFDPRAWERVCTPAVIRSLIKAYDAALAELTQGAGEALVDKSPDLQGSLVDKTANLQGRAGEAVEPVATVVSWTNSSYSRNYKLTWHKDVPEGTKLHTATQLQQAVALVLAPIRQAIRDCHYALDTHQHGDIALDRAMGVIKNHLGMHWQQGKEAAIRAKGTHQ